MKRQKLHSPEILNPMLTAYSIRMAGWNLIKFWNLTCIEGLQHSNPRVLPLTYNWIYRSLFISLCNRNVFILGFLGILMLLKLKLIFLAEESENYQLSPFSCGLIEKYFLPSLVTLSRSCVTIPWRLIAGCHNLSPRSVSQTFLIVKENYEWEDFTWNPPRSYILQTGAGPGLSK